MGARHAAETVVLEIVEAPRDLAAGGVFVPGCALPLDTACTLLVRGPAGELTLEARVVFADGAGAGLQILGWTQEMKSRILALLVEPEPAAEGPDRAAPKNVNERLRNLTLAQQVKIARSGEQHERIVLERMYGKNVWEPLLHNPRLTAPEVARIARMGTLPRIMLELICSNGTWLQIPEVRRALLGNPRLGTDQILRILRLLPKHELKLAAVQTAYPFVVRDAAKRMTKPD